MSDPGRRQGLSASALWSTSSIDRPSSVPGTVGSIVGCDGGAVATGRVFVSTPSEGSADFCSPVATMEDDGCGVAESFGASAAFRSRGVYSVVNVGAG